MLREEWRDRFVGLGSSIRILGLYAKSTPCVKILGREKASNQLSRKVERERSLLYGGDLPLMMTMVPICIIRRT